MNQLLNRRHFLARTAAAAAGLACAAPFAAGAASLVPLRIVSNPGLENAMLSALLREQRFLERFGAIAQFIEAKGPSGPLDAITAGRADVCLVSGYNGVLGRIAQGSPVRLIGAGMRKTALAMYAHPETARTLAELRGCTIAVGPKRGLLHSLTIELLEARGINPAAVHFVDRGSNDQCHDAVVNGEADACCSSVSHLYDADGLAPLRDGRLWDVLPGPVFQTAYASLDALRDRQDDLARVMAAYGALYEYMMSPSSRAPVAAARRQGSEDPAAWAVADFNIVQRPYTSDLSLTAAEIDALQASQLRLGLLRAKLPIQQIADMRAAHAAAHLLKS